MGGSGTRFHRRRGRSWREPGELLAFALYFLCVVLLVLSRIGHGVIADTRDRLADLTAPLLGAASAPVVEFRHGFDRVRSYLGLFGEIDRLKAENEGLKAWEWRASDGACPGRGRAAAAGLLRRHLNADHDGGAWPRAQRSCQQSDAHQPRRHWAVLVGRAKAFAT